MKLHTFFKSLGYLLFLNLLIKPVWIFGVDRQVQNVVGHTTYGSYFALLSLTLVLQFFADAGLTQMVNRQVAAGQQFNGRQLLRTKLLLLMGYLLLVAVLGAVTGILNWRLLALVAVVQALTSFLVFLRHLVTAYQLFTTDAVLSVIDKGLMLLIFLPLLYTSLVDVAVTIYFFLYIQIACTLTVVVAALVVIRSRGLLQKQNNTVQPAVTLAAVLPFAIIVLLMSAHNRLDGFLLERWHANGAYEAGLYAAAYRLLDAGNMIGYLTASFLVPFIAKQQSNKSLIKATVLSARFGLLLAGGVVTVFVVVFAKQVQALLYPALPPQSVPVLQACIGVLPAYLLLHVYGSVLTAAAQLKSFILLLAGAFMLNVLLNIWLIPLHGAWGSCIAALVSQYALALVCYVVACQKLQLPFAVGSLSAVLVAVAGAGGLFWAARQNVLNPFWLLLIGGGGAAVLLLVYIPVFKKQFVSSG